MAHLLIKNKKTGKEYAVTQLEYDALKQSNQARKFTIIERVEPIKINVPKEVEEAVQLKKSQTKPK